MILVGALNKHIGAGGHRYMCTNGQSHLRGVGTSLGDGGKWTGESGSSSGAGREGSCMGLSLNSISASSKWHRHCSAVFKDADNNDADPWYLLS